MRIYIYFKLATIMKRRNILLLIYIYDALIHDALVDSCKSACVLIDARRYDYEPPMKPQLLYNYTGMAVVCVHCLLILMYLFFGIDFRFLLSLFGCFAWSH